MSTGLYSRVAQQFIILDANADREIETAFATLIQRGAGALIRRLVAKRSPPHARILSNCNCAASSVVAVGPI